jgi:GNAT superfamily N-acetyltransferase
MPTVTLEPAVAEDAQVLAELRALAMRPSLEAIERFDPERARTRFLSGFDSGCTWHIVSDGVRAGVLVLRAEGDTSFLLDHLYVHPSYQGQALGAAALQHVFAQARQQGRSVRVGALKGSRSNQFYLRHGFKPAGVGDWDNYYTWSPESAA